MLTDTTNRILDLAWSNALVALADDMMAEGRVHLAIETYRLADDAAPGPSWSDILTQPYSAD